MASIELADVVTAADSVDYTLLRFDRVESWAAVALQKSESGIIYAYQLTASLRQSSMLLELRSLKAW